MQLANALRVLVVDDDAEIRELVAMILSGEGYDVETAEHGLDALARLESGEPPALVLLDLMMPEMSGWELLPEARGRGLLVEVPVVAMSAAANRHELPDGIAAFLAKPFGVDALIGVVASHACPPGRLRPSGSFRVSGSSRFGSA
jgi:CheY-like chemotaxis protein